MNSPEPDSSDAAPKRETEPKTKGDPNSETESQAEGKAGDSNSPATIDEYPIRLTLSILWGDQDLFGHVNNVVYFRWFESSRVVYWDRAMRAIMTPNDWGPILASVKCNYRKQLRYPDTITIGARITRVGRTSLTMEHAIYSEEHQAIAADGESIVVVFNYKEQRPVRLTEELRAAIDQTELGS